MITRSARWKGELGDGSELIVLAGSRPQGIRTEGEKLGWRNGRESAREWLWENKMRAGKVCGRGRIFR